VHGPFPAHHDDHDVALVGTLPIVLGWGAGAGRAGRRPGGRRRAAVSQTLTLYITPVFYLPEALGRRSAAPAGACAKPVGQVA
jgi:hypothetical protein